MGYILLLAEARTKHSPSLAVRFWHFLGGAWNLESLFSWMQMCAQVSGLSVQTVVERSCEQQWPLGLGKVKG